MNSQFENLLKFLLGESLHRGASFGDAHPGELGMFWWRKDLRAEMHEHQTDMQQVRVLNASIAEEAANKETENQMLRVQVEHLRLALQLAKDMMVENGLDLPHTMNVINAALTRSINNA
jgi:hypothetical protein